eukprot:4224478-Pleurochrysis_carterae.AAC.4
MAVASKPTDLQTEAPRCVPVLSRRRSWYTFSGYSVFVQSRLTWQQGNASMMRAGTGRETRATEKQAERQAHRRTRLTLQAVVRDS